LLVLFAARQIILLFNLAREQKSLATPDLDNERKIQRVFGGEKNEQFVLHKKMEQFCSENINMKVTIQKCVFNPINNISIWSQLSLNTDKEKQALRLIYLLTQLYILLNNLL